MAIKHRLANTGSLLTNTYFDETAAATVQFTANNVVGQLNEILNIVPITTFITTTGYSTFTVPSNFGSLISIEAIGAGAGSNTAAGGSANGQGGGAYSKITSLSGLTAGVTASVFVGQGILGGQDSWFNISSNAAPTLTTQGVLAKGGTSANATSTGLGGQAAAGVGTIKFSGGDAAANNVGGGGGAAGPGGNGGAGAAGGGGAAGGTAPGGAGGYPFNFIFGPTNLYYYGNGGDGGDYPFSGGNGLVLNNNTGFPTYASGPTAGTGGGGGAGSANGASGSWWTQTSNGAQAGPGGGGGGSVGGQAGAGGAYGGGAGSGNNFQPGGQGIIVLTYNSIQPVIRVSNTGIISINKSGGQFDEVSGVS